MMMIRVLPLLFFCTVFFFQATATQLNANDVVQFSPHCHYSCSACIGPLFTDCVKCKKGAALIQSGMISDVTVDGLSGKTFSIVYGECACQLVANGSPNALKQFNATLDYAVDGCQSAKDIDAFLDGSGKWLAISNIILSTITLFVELRMLPLLDVFDTLQYFGNFAIISQKNLRSFDYVSYAYMRANPTFLMSQSLLSDDEEDSSDILAYANITAIRSFTSPIQFTGYSSFYSTVNVTYKNALQPTRYFSLSQLLANHGSQLSYFSMGIHFIIIISSIYLASLLYHVAHVLVLKKYFSTDSAKKRVAPNAQVNSSDSSSSSSSSSESPRAFETKIEAYRKEARLESEYLNSKYHKVYKYIITSSLTFFYISINEQMIYMQVAYFLGTATTDAKSTIITVLATIILLAHLTQVLMMSRRPDSPFVKLKTVIFDGIKQQQSWMIRKITLLKVFFKIVENLVFFQFQQSRGLQCSFLLALAAIQLVMYAFLRPFNNLKYNILLVAQQSIKAMLVSAFLVADSISGTDQLDGIYMALPIMQDFYLFGIFAATMAEYCYIIIQRIINWNFARKFKKEQAKQKSVKLDSDLKDRSALIEMSATKNPILLNNHSMLLNDQSTLYFAPDNNNISNNVSHFYDGSPEFKSQIQSKLHESTLNHSPLNKNQSEITINPKQHRKNSNKSVEITLNPTEPSKDRWMNTMQDNYIMTTQGDQQHELLKRTSPLLKKSRKQGNSKTPSPPDVGTVLNLNNSSPPSKNNNNYNNQQILRFDEIKETVEEDMNSQTREEKQESNSRSDE